VTISLNGTKIDVTMFPDKTSQVWKVPEDLFKCKQYDVVFEFDHEGEIMHLVQLVDLIKHGHIPRPVNLHMPYLPYGRQDKDIDNNATFALSSFCRVINMLHFDSVTTLDAHSMKADEYLWNFKNIHPVDEISSRIHALMDGDGADNVKMAFPDAGAYKRYGTKFNYLKKEDFIIGHKNRDQLTGYITEYTIEGNPSGKDILIIDDICDGGMTFKLLARDLLKGGAKSVNLYVTHGIFSKGVKTILDSGVSRVFTKDGEVFPSKHTNFLTKET